VSTKTGKLPRGRHSVPRREVIENQRQRMLDAVAATIAEDGPFSLSVRQVHERAGVSRSTFYEQFRDKYECVTADYEAAFEQVAASILLAAEASEDWPSGISAGVAAALEFATEFPDRIHLLAVFETVVAEPQLSRRTSEAQRRLVALLYAGREQRGCVRAPLELTERVVLGGAMYAIGAQILGGRSGRLSELRPELVQLILAPYIGDEEAGRFALAG